MTEVKARAATRFWCQRCKAGKKTVGFCENCGSLITARQEDQEDEKSR